MPSTIRAIAKQTGFSTATVSSALRDRGRMSSATRETIQAAARQLGYQPLPLLSKAFSLARQPQASRYRETLGLIVEYPMKNAPYFQQKIHDAALNRAHSMGFKLEPFLLSGRPADHRRLSRNLHTRGIRGLIVMPRLEYRLPRLFLDWEHFAAVEIGRTLFIPVNLHRVERPVYYELIKGFHLLKKAGYHRIGLAVEPTEDKKRHGIYSAAYLVYRQLLPPRFHIPPLASTGPWKIRTFQQWLKKYQPDVLVIHDHETILSWAQKLNMKCPRDISIFGCNVGTSPLSGFRADLKNLGESAVEMLSLLLDRNELGLAAHPRCWQVSDEWQEGTSLKYPPSVPFGVPALDA